MMPEDDRSHGAVASDPSWVVYMHICMDITTCELSYKGLDP
mgnify:FL=1